MGDVVAGLEAGGPEDGVHLVGVGHHQPHERRAVAVRPADGSPRLVGDEPLRRRRRRGHEHHHHRETHRGRRRRPAAGAVAAIVINYTLACVGFVYS